MSRGSDDWERGAEYLIGKWHVDASDDLDIFAERVKALTQKKVVLEFRPGATVTTPRPGGAVVLNLRRERKRIADRPKNNEERIKRAYGAQRQAVEDKIRANKVDKIRAGIAALEALELPVEREIKLAHLKESFEAHLQDSNSSFLQPQCEGYEWRTIDWSWERAKRTKAAIKAAEEAVAAAAVSVEYEVKLDILKRDFEKELVKCGYDPELEGE